MHQIKKHPEIVLAVLALVLGGMIAAYYFWGIGRLIVHMNTALESPSGNAQSGEFNTDAAKKILKARGIIE